MRTFECLNAPGLAKPAGHYSHAVVHAGIAYLAGQLPHVPGQPDRKPGTIEEQARQVLSNIDRDKVRRYATAYRGPNRALVDKYLETMR